MTVGASDADEHDPCGSRRCLRLKVSKGAVFVPSSFPIATPVRPPALTAAVVGGQVRDLIDELGRVADPRSPLGLRYALPSLLALAVCAMTPAGNDSLTAAAEWCKRAAPEELAAFGLPYDVLRGRFRIPSEKTLRRVLACWIRPRSVRRASSTSLRSCTRPHRRRPHAPEVSSNANSAAPIDKPSTAIAPRRSGVRTRWTASACAGPTGLTAAASSCCPPSGTATASPWPAARSARKPTKSLSSSPCWTRSPTPT